MTEQNILQEMTDAELRQFAKETIDRMTDQNRAKLLEWVKGGKTMDSLDLNATVHFSGVDEAVKTAASLQEKINEAKTRAVELALLIDELKVKVEM